MKHDGSLLRLADGFSDYSERSAVRVCSVQPARSPIMAVETENLVIGEADIEYLDVVVDQIEIRRSGGTELQIQEEISRKLADPHSIGGLHIRTDFCTIPEQNNLLGTMPGNTVTVPTNGNEYILTFCSEGSCTNCSEPVYREDIILVIPHP
jgi:hypothetical protein